MRILETYYPFRFVNSNCWPCLARGRNRAKFVLERYFAQNLGSWWKHFGAPACTTHDRITIIGDRFIFLHLPGTSEEGRRRQNLIFEYQAVNAPNSKAVVKEKFVASDERASNLDRIDWDPEEVGNQELFCALLGIRSLFRLFGVLNVNIESLCNFKDLHSVVKL